MPIINRIGEMQTEMTEWRHDFHAHPELAFEEIRTSGIVVEKLTEWGVDEVYEGIGKTGVVGVLHGKEKGDNSIGLRADMDALPMQEDNEFAHKSTIDGKMHACGHDGHTTMLLGAAKYLAETRNFKGKVFFIFQPAEEGYAGADAMIKDGLFEKFKIDEVYGMHNWPELPLGTMGVAKGPMMAAADRFIIKIKGKGGHAAMPHHCIDPVVIAAQIITAAQSLVSRMRDPQDPAVVSIPVIDGGTAFNVIPDDVTLKGTARTFKPETRTAIEEGLEKIAKNIAEAFGATIEYTYNKGYPPTVNHAQNAEIAADIGAKILGDDKIIRDVTPCMGAEDFAFMLEKKEGAYVWMGQESTGHGCMVHNTHYDFNDDILPLGASFWAEIVQDRLS